RPASAGRERRAPPPTHPRRRAPRDGRLPTRPREPRDTHRARRARAPDRRPSCRRRAAAGSPAARAAATATRLARTRLVHLEGAAAELVAVERFDRGVGILFVHLDEAEATGLPRLPIVDQRAGVNAAVLLEQLTDLVLGGA